MLKNYRESLELRRLPRYEPPSLSLSLSLLLSLSLSLSLSLDRSLSLPLSLERDLVLDLLLLLPPPSLLLSLSFLLFLSPSLSLLSTALPPVVGLELELDVLSFLALAAEAGMVRDDCFSFSLSSWLSFSPPNSVMYSTLLSTSGLVERELEPLLQNQQMQKKLKNKYLQCIHKHNIMLIHTCTCMYSYNGY